MSTPAYVLGQSQRAEFRLELLNELTSTPFVEAIGRLQMKKVRILNIGCGSGHLEAKLSMIFSDSHFVGIDISEARIKEAYTRITTLKSSNTFEFIQADLTSVSIENLKPCDILIFRFVLSHLPNPIKQLERFLPLVQLGGVVCLEELASDGTEYFCNTKNAGYQTFLKMVEVQMKEQQSSFDIGFHLLAELSKCPYRILHTHLTQAILHSTRHKSILRLGLEDAKPILQKNFDQKKIEETISSLQQFEKDESSFGLYTRSLAVIAQMGSVAKF